MFLYVIVVLFSWTRNMQHVVIPDYMYTNSCIFWSFSSVFNDKIQKANQHVRNNKLEFDDDGEFAEDEDMDPATRTFNKKQKEVNVAIDNGWRSCVHSKEHCWNRCKHEGINYEPWRLKQYVSYIFSMCQAHFHDLIEIATQMKRVPDYFCTCNTTHIHRVVHTGRWWTHRDRSICWCKDWNPSIETRK